MYVIGIDIGSTITKVIQVKDKKIINKAIYAEKDIYDIIDRFIKDKNIKLNEIEKFVLTGIGTLKIKKNIFNIPTKVVNEFEAVANCTKEESLIISIGTGTAFILKTKDRVIHLGGSGLGGGTLLNLSNQLTGIKNFEKIKDILKGGNIFNVDLKLKDVSEQNFSNLSMDTTISNFGKIGKEATDADIIIGILNMIIESIAVMAAMALKNTTIKDATVIGTITSLPEIKEILKRVSKLHNINFIIPKNSEFATIIGAIIASSDFLEN